MYHKHVKHKHDYYECATIGYFELYSFRVASSKNYPKLRISTRKWDSGDFDGRLASNMARVSSVRGPRARGINLIPDQTSRETRRQRWRSSSRMIIDAVCQFALGRFGKKASKDFFSGCSLRAESFSPQPSRCCLYANRGKIIYLPSRT